MPVMRILCNFFCLTICLPSGSSSYHLFSLNNIFFLCWTCRDNRPILFTQTVSFLFFFWDIVSFLMTATKWKFGLLNYWILIVRPFTFTYQGSFKQCAALASLYCHCLLHCFCEISERFSPLLFHLSVFEHEPAWKECTEGPEDKKNYSQGKTKLHPNHSLLTEPEISAPILAL